ncbi:MAG TPA: DUF1080 domain-containing protein [Bryobacteraceae bacterium]|nr:DUF1080 domain-containing protein [Bryobacteraceae bacterium]
MKQLYLLPIAFASFLPMAAAPGNPFVGRWDITVTTPRDTYPDWMEVKQTDGNLSALIQPRSASTRVASDVKLQGSHLTLTLIPATDQGPATTWDLTMDGDKLTGAIKRGDTAQGQLSGVRAPALKRPMPTRWTTPEPIFNGKNLTGWEPITPANNHWVVKGGELVNEDHGSNLRSTRKFADFKLHIEYNCPDKGNSGIYLRGRYEVQVEYEPLEANDQFHRMGSIYSFLAPAVELPRKPGEWESYDVTLVGRWVTILRNGVKTIDNQEIAGITGGALDSHEGEPGPFYIQGDHTGGLKYRNITIALPN